MVVLVGSSLPFLLQFDKLSSGSYLFHVRPLRTSRRFVFPSFFLFDTAEYDSLLVSA